MLGNKLKQLQQEMEWKPRLVLIGMSLILKKLSDIPIFITTSETTNNSGTKLIITNEYGNDLADEINEIDSQKVEKII